MVWLREPVSHGPHLWFANILFINDECWVDFLGNQQHWEQLPVNQVVQDWSSVFKVKE